MDRMEMVALRPVMDSPPAKRTRRRAPSTTSDARSSSRRDTRSEIRPVWHPDGDLVLEVEGCLFKIHCHRLSCSEVFADMFALPQPPDAERIEDSPLVRLQDNARDWIVALGWVYDPEGFIQQPHQHAFETLASALRISCKYEIAEMRSWAVEGMRTIWPEDITQMTTTALPRAAEFIALTRTLDLPSLARALPAAFYALSIPRLGNPMHTTYLIHVLPPQDLVRFLCGSSSLQALSLELALNPFGPVLGQSSVQFCSRECDAALRRVWCVCLTTGAMGDPSGWPWGLCLVRALLRLAHGEVDGTAQSEWTAICDQCRFLHDTLVWGRLQELKRRIPSMFDL